MCFITKKNLCLIFSSSAVLGPYSIDCVIIRLPNIQQNSHSVHTDSLMLIALIHHQDLFSTVYTI